MPAAMEKKYLSYSVRALRPNGGLDPLPRQMRKEALQASISGFSLNDPVCPEPPPPRHWQALRCSCFRAQLAESCTPALGCQDPHAPLATLAV